MPNYIHIYLRDRCLLAFNFTHIAVLVAVAINKISCRSYDPILNLTCVEENSCKLAQFCSVVVITFASHAKGPRFEPGQNYFFI